MEKERAALIGRLFELVREAQRRNDEFDQAVADYLGVSRTEARCMDILDQAGPMTAGELAEGSRLTTGAITKIVDRLEALGYVRRRPDPGDRRRVIVDLTPRTRRLAGELYALPPKVMDDFQALFSDRDLRMLVTYFEKGREIAELRQTRLQTRRPKR